MTEAEVALLINSLSATLPSLIALYKQITENRQGVKTLQELLSDADAQYDANIRQLQGE